MAILSEGMVESRHSYRNPPIDEAICEFRFSTHDDWDFTIPGKLQNALGDEYHGKSNTQKAIQVGLQLHQGNPPGFHFAEDIAKVQLSTIDKSRLVGVGPGVLSIHMLKPYMDSSLPEDKRGWAEFNDRIKSALEAYHNIANRISVEQVGIRYINKVPLPIDDSLRVEEYLRCAHLEIEGLPDSYSYFMSRIQYEYDNDCRLILSHGALDATESILECLLDIDVIQQTAYLFSSDIDDSLQIVSNLHARAFQAFEAVITDKARAIFNVSS